MGNSNSYTKAESDVKISDIETNYSKKTDVDATYAKKSELDDYVKKSSDSFSKPSDLSDYMKISSDSYVKPSELSDYIKKSSSDYVKPSDISSFIKSTSNDYVKPSTLDTYLLKSDADIKYVKVADADTKYMKVADGLKTTDADTKYVKLTDTTYLKTAVANSTYLTSTTADTKYVKLSDTTYLKGTDADTKYVKVSDVSGYLKSSDSGVSYPVKKGSYVHFGSDDTTKDTNAGKIGYNISTTTPASTSLDIFGAGTPTTNRVVKIYDSLITGNIAATAIQSTGNIDAKSKYALLNTPGWIGPYQLKLYGQANKCIDSSVFASATDTGSAACAATPVDTQKFFLNVASGQILASATNKCLTRSATSWVFADCNPAAPDQQFDKVDHGIRWKNGTCLDTGNVNQNATCNSASINQQIVFNYVG